MKQDIYGNRADLELRMPDIKTYLYEKVGKTFDVCGFKFKKSNFSFKKKSLKNYESFTFLFYNYFPLNYKFQFLLEIWNNEIETIKLSLPIRQNIESFNFRSVSIPMGDFLDEGIIKSQVKKWTGLKYDSSTNEFIKDGLNHLLNNLTWVQISSFAYELYDSKDLFETSDELKKILQEKALPLSNQLSTIDGIDKFFEGRPGWSVNSLSLNNFATELIAAKLNAKRDFHIVFHQIVGSIQLKIVNKAMSEETRGVVEELYKYLQIN